MHDGEVHRAIFHAGRTSYEQFCQSGLYDRLVAKRLIVQHEELLAPDWALDGCWRVIRPERIPFISYAYEWSFNQLKDAALAMLDIQREALRVGMTLKDAPSANIQFLKGRPVLIDTLSLVPVAGQTWPAYFQFCKHFVAPLLLASYIDASTLRWLAVEADGIPLELAAAALPWRSKFCGLSLWHVHLHAKANRSAALASAGVAQGSSDGSWRQEAIIDSLARGIERLRPATVQSEWTRYADDHPTYTSAAWDAKVLFVERVLASEKPGVVWDLGMAAGHFSRRAARAGAMTIGFDSDAASVDKAYLALTHAGTEGVLPLVQNLLRPTPASGWAGRELAGLVERGPADLLLVLGLVHHLAVRGGVPYRQQFEFYAQLASTVVIELIPPTDPVVIEWSTRFEIRGVDQQAFEAAAAAAFTTVERFPIPSSERVLYTLRRK